MQSYCLCSLVPFHEQCSSLCPSVDIDGCDFFCVLLYINFSYVLKTEEEESYGAIGAGLLSSFFSLDSVLEQCGYLHTGRRIKNFTIHINTSVPVSFHFLHLS